MARKRLSQDFKATLDYEKVKQDVSRWGGEERFEIPLQEEAKTLFER